MWKDLSKIKVTILQKQNQLAEKGFQIKSIIQKHDLFLQFVRETEMFVRQY